MSTFEIIMTCIGFLLCVMVLALVTITIFGIVWWVFKTEVDITPENEKEDYGTISYTKDINGNINLKSFVLKDR